MSVAGDALGVITGGARAVDRPGEATPARVLDVRLVHAVNALSCEVSGRTAGDVAPSFVVSVEEPQVPRNIEGVGAAR